MRGAVVIGHRGRVCALFCLCLAGAAVVAGRPQPPLRHPPPAPRYAEQTLSVLGPVFHIDRLYRSMQGPFAVQEVRLPVPANELVWITGFRASMVLPDGRTPCDAQFMCHSNLDISGEYHRWLFGQQKLLDDRLVTLSQGQLALKFPEGFGIPLLASEPLALTMQVLNLNLPQPALSVRHRVEIDYVADRDRTCAFRPLFEVGVFGLVSLEGRPLAYDAEPEDRSGRETLCLPGRAATADEVRDALDQRFAGHWVVPPGLEVRRTDVTRLMNLPFDTTIHYIAVHLHPFAESLELRDATDGRTIFRSRARPLTQGIGLEHVDCFASTAGVPVYVDHTYELVSVYNNTSGQAQDSMAVMYLYLLDKEFRWPRPAPPQR